jgi:DNA-3-methyladenine glycosylase I
MSETTVEETTVGETIVGPDGILRCRWAGAAPEFAAYHDTEWGFPVGDDRRLFEKLSLEGFQSGLNWRTILAKRPNFRAAFHDFDVERIARFTQEDRERLLADAGIVRHRGKIEAVINNAQRACELIARDGSLAAFLWRFEPAPEQLAAPQTASGWKFVGPTTVYAFMQAMGLINDHVEACAIRSEVERARASFTRPALSRLA